jgi:hypothetical protein
MDLETPADAWYIWIGVMLVSTGAAGIALSLPSEAPPDAEKAANSIDEVSASAYNASASYEHDADEVKLDATRISFRNDGGTTRATIGFGSMTPVREHPNDSQPGLDVLWGEPVSAVFDSPEAFAAWAKEARAAADESAGEWRVANGELRVKRIYWGGVSVTLVDA